MTDFTIRPIGAEDDPAVRRIIEKVMTEFGCTGEGYAIHDAEVRHMHESYSGERTRYWVVVKDGAVVGGGGIAPLKGGDGKTCELRKMYFLEEARGIGAGRRLMEEALAFAKAAGYTKCYLETVAQMSDARKLYEKTGFSREGRPMGDTGHFTCDTWYSMPL